MSSTAAFLKTKNTKARDNKMFCSANDSFSFLKLIFFLSDVISDFKDCFVKIMH